MNILFSTKENEKNRLIGLIDWQMSHRGYGPEDLARLLAVCATHEFKKKHGDEILHRYLFNKKIKNTTLKPIEYENVKSVFDQMYGFVAFTFASSVNVIEQLVESCKDAEERQRLKEKYIEHCEQLCNDAMETLGW